MNSAGQENPKMPKVTVVTPNYNHARYLPRRLESVLNQTFGDFELIILDDASTDNSREVIELYARDPRVTTIYNAQNKGNTFKQWELGLSHANGEYVWFAESDDYAEPTLLETLVDRLDRHPGAGLAFCQSWAVDEDCNKLYKASDSWAIHEESDHWRADFVNSGSEECANYLFWYNTIPNASAVLVRRDALERAGGVCHHMRLCGDWATYVSVLSIADVAFVSEPLNYFRQHPNTVRGRSVKQGLMAREMRAVHRTLIERHGLARLLRDQDEGLDKYVRVSIGAARRPPHNKVPLGESIVLLSWLARVQPRAVGIALPILAWEQMADLSRRVGLLGLARRVKNALAMSGR
jgi:glycosyltransferase involved in cell wall biosynthesis